MPYLQINRPQGFPDVALVGAWDWGGVVGDAAAFGSAVEIMDFLIPVEEKTLDSNAMGNGAAGGYGQTNVGRKNAGGVPGPPQNRHGRQR